MSTTNSGLAVQASRVCLRRTLMQGILRLGCVLLSPAVMAQVPPDPFNYSRTVSYERDGVTGWVTAEVLEPNYPQLCVRTESQYDEYGNRRETVQRHCAATTGSAQIATRVTGSLHVAEGSTPAGLAPTVITNAELHVERRQIDTRYGGVARVQDANGLVSRVDYDHFGRRSLEVRADGNQTRWSYGVCASVGGPDICPTGSAAGGAVLAYFIRLTPLNAAGLANGPIATSFFDTEGREIRSETEAYAAGTMRTRVVLREYDALGRVVRHAGPFFVGDAAAEWVVSVPDALGRTVEETRANPNAGGLSRSTTTYRGRVVTRTNSLNQTETKESDEYGRVTRVADAQGNQISYQRDAFGNVAVLRDPLGNVTTMTYDFRGRKVGMFDPDLGSWSYEVDVLGQLVKETSPSLQAASFAYDRLGRPTRRIETDLDSYWYHDRKADGTACGASLGALCEARTTTGYVRVNTYDALGRLTRTATTLASGANGTHVTKFTYDSSGRVDQRVWPTGLAVQHVYNTQGVLLRLRDVAAGTAYWERQENNARGQLVRAQTGNGLIQRNTWQDATGLAGALEVGTAASYGGVVSHSYGYNALHNMTSRYDANTGVSEGFQYDKLNRITTQTLVGSTVNRNAYYHYNAIGNITYNSDVGTYDYTARSGETARPHAVRRIGGQAGKLTNPEYFYDANGNLERVTGANGVTRTTSWTSFNMPLSMSLSARGVSSSFLYGSEHQRIRQVVSRDGQSRTIYYLHPDAEGGLFFEREETAGGVATNRHFLSVEGGVFLQIEAPGALQVDPVATNLTGTQLRYLHKDHLGSVVAITDGVGSVLERLAYEPFGKRRHPGGQFDSSGDIDAVRTKRGFTEHEQLDELDYVHMNGRVYDPDIARFVSADPGVPHVYDLQSFNRYSYTRNNPLNSIDPTGFADGENGEDGGSDGDGGNSPDGATTPEVDEAPPEIPGTLAAGKANGVTQSVANLGSKNLGLSPENSGLSPDNCPPVGEDGVRHFTIVGERPRTGGTSGGHKPFTLGDAFNIVDAARANGTFKGPYIGDVLSDDPLSAYFRSRGLSPGEANTAAMATAVFSPVLLAKNLTKGVVKGGTYALKNADGVVMRTGRSKDLARREGEHARDPALSNLTFQVVHRTDVRAEQRGLEQMLHDLHNPPLNAIRPISLRNINLEDYLDAARMFLDRLGSGK